MIPINQVQKQSGGGLFGKVLGGINSAVGVGEVVGGALTGNPQMALKGVGDASSGASALTNKGTPSSTSPLQNASNSLDNQALAVVQAKDAVNSSNIAEPDRLKYMAHFNETLNALNQRRNVTGIG